MYNQNITQDIQELYYNQMYSEGAFGSSSMPAASSGAAKEAANKHRKAAETATSVDDRKKHRDSAARYEVTARRMSMTADHYEFLVGYLINEGFVSDLDSAAQVIESMSEGWIQSIFEQNLNEVTGMGRVVLRLASDALKRGMKKAPITKLDNKLGQLNHEIKGVRKTGSSKDLENIEQRIRKLNAVKDSRSMQKSRQAVRNITNLYK